MKNAAIFAFVLISACGPAVRNNSVPMVAAPPQVQPSRTFQTRDQGRRNLLNDLSALDVTPATNLPFSGTLNYDGHLNAALGSGTEVIGDLTIAVDIGREQISGRADNFTDQSNRNLDGQLELFNGTFDETAPQSEYQTRAGVRGTLTDRFSRDYAVSGQLEGDLLGGNAQGFEAVLSGAVKVNGGPQEPIKGGAVAVRR